MIRKTNKEIIEQLKSLEPNTLYVGHVIVGDWWEDKSRGIELPKTWEVLKPRIEKFLSLKSSIHEKYYGTPTYPCQYGITESENVLAIPKYAQISKSARCKSMYVSIMVFIDGEYRWCYGERISYEDFYDIYKFEEKYSKELRGKRLKTIKESQERLLVKLGKLVDEQDRLEREED